jgi:hypothetical protein
MSEMTERFNVSRIVRRVAIAAVMVMGLSSLTSVVWAYPPGQDLTVTTQKATVLKGRNFYFKLNNAKPGPVSVKLNGVTVGGTAGVDGKATIMIPATSYGVFLATAKSGAETATTRVYVPSFSLLNTFGEVVYGGRRGHFLAVKVVGVKFGTLVTVLAGNKLYTNTAWTTSIAKVKFQIPNKPGPSTVVVNLAGQNKTIPYLIH